MRLTLEFRLRRPLPTASGSVTPGRRPLPCGRGSVTPGSVTPGSVTPGSVTPGRGGECN